MADSTHILLIGSTYWCRELASLISTHSSSSGYTAKRALRWLFRSNRQLVLVGLGVPNSWKRKLYFFLARALFLLRVVPTPVVFWIGSDTLSLSVPGHSLKRYRHVAGSEWLAKEVQNCGYDCTTSLFPVALDYLEALPMPVSDRLRVLCYVPDTAPDTHGGHGIAAAARALPDCDFTVVGGEGAWLAQKPKNMRFVGWTDSIKQYLADTHVLIRNTPHDSLSAFVREGLMAGRYVLFTHQFPGVLKIEAGRDDTLIHELEQLRYALNTGGLETQRLEAKIERNLRNVESQVSNLVKTISRTALQDTR